MTLSEGAGSLDRLVTEARRADADYDSRATSELVELMNDEDETVPAAVAPVAEELAAAIDAIVARLEAGGRLSSAERETAEDDAAAGRRAVEELAVSAADAVVGVSASGRTPFVLAALEAAAEAGALTVALTAVEESYLARGADHELAVVVG